MNGECLSEKKKKRAAEYFTEKFTVTVCAIGDIVIIGTLLNEIAHRSVDSMRPTSILVGLYFVGVGAGADLAMQKMQSSTATNRTVELFDDDLNSPVGSYRTTILDPKSLPDQALSPAQSRYLPVEF